MNNNARELRYLAKLTHNPAAAHGLAAHEGSVRADRLADLVLWQPAWFGAAPELVVKSGSGSGPTRLTRPRRMLRFYGGTGGAPARLSHVFVSAHARTDELPVGRN